MRVSTKLREVRDGRGEEVVRREGVRRVVRKEVVTGTRISSRIRKLGKEGEGEEVVEEEGGRGVSNMWISVERGLDPDWSHRVVGWGSSIPSHEVRVFREEECPVTVPSAQSPSGWG